MDNPRSVRGTSAPATKWPLRVNLRDDPQVYLNVQLGPQRQRTTITHEAAARAGKTYRSFYMVFVRTDSGKVGSLVADGADAIIRTDWRRPADPGERGPDILLDAEDMRHLAGYLRVGWKDGEEYRVKTLAWETTSCESHQGTKVDVRRDSEDRDVQGRPRHEGHVRQHPV